MISAKNKQTNKKNNNLVYLSYHDVPFQELGRLQTDADSVSVACADVAKAQTTKRTVERSQKCGSNYRQFARSSKSEFKLTQS